jgi:Fe-S-cluster containining protein
MSTRAEVRCAPGCGACCDPVVLDFDPATWNGPSAPFMREHWTLRSRATGQSGAALWLMDCAAFDPRTRLCTAYEQRPPICSGYPRYGEPVTPQRCAGSLPPSCTFNADVRRMLPIVAVRRGADRRDA